MIETRQQFDRAVTDLAISQKYLEIQILGMLEKGQELQEITKATDAAVSFRQGMYEETLDYANQHAISLEEVEFPSSPVKFREELLSQS